MTFMGPSRDVPGTFLGRRVPAGKFENYKNCLGATQLDNKIKYLEKKKNNIDSLKKILNNS